MSCLFFTEINVCHRRFEMLRAQKNKSRIAFEVFTSSGIQQHNVQAIKKTELGTIAPIARFGGHRLDFLQVQGQELPALLGDYRFHVGDRSF